MSEIAYVPSADLLSRLRRIVRGYLLIIGIVIALIGGMLACLSIQLPFLLPYAAVILALSSGQIISAAAIKARSKWPLVCGFIFTVIETAGLLLKLFVVSVLLEIIRNSQANVVGSVLWKFAVLAQEAIILWYACNILLLAMLIILDVLLIRCLFEHQRASAEVPAIRAGRRAKRSEEITLDEYIRGE